MLETIRFEINNKKDIERLFEKLKTSKIEKLYLESNDLLQDLNIMPNLRPNYYFNFLMNHKLETTIKSLTIRNESFSNLNLIEHYQKLRRLQINNCSSLYDFKPLLFPNLEEKLINLDLSETRFSNLELLKNYQKLEELIIYETLIPSISNLLDYDFVKNNSLKKIWLPKTIDWAKVKDGKYVNTEVVKELKKRQVKVYLPNYSFDGLTPKPKVYVLLGPSAAGKSTTIDKLICDLGYSKLDKITNRPPRETDSNYIRFANKLELEFLDKKKQLVGAHIYHGNFYAYDLRQLQEAQDNTKIYLTDTCDVDAALALREMFPNLIEIIGINPLTDLRGKALENRITTHNNEDLYQEQKNNTKERLKEIRQENQTMERLKELGTTIIEGQTYEKTFQDIKGIIQGN